MILNTLMWCLLMVINTSPNKTLMERSTPLNPSEMIRPSNLKLGDTVAVIATASILKQDAEVIQKTKTLLTSWGLNVVFGNHLETKSHHFAGTDAQRTSDLQWALDHPNIKAIWCVRGGYGTLRIIDNLDFEGFKTHPKWVVGYSDVTVLHNTLNNLGYESLHAMMCINLTEDSEAIKPSIETLKNALFGQLKSYEIDSHSENKTGKASGQLVGGNLSLLTAALGSNTSIDTLGKMNELVEHASALNKKLKSFALITHAPTNPNMDDKKETEEILSKMPNFINSNVFITYRSSYWRTMGRGLSVLEYTDDKAKNEILSLGSEVFSHG